MRQGLIHFAFHLIAAASVATLGCAHDDAAIEQKDQFGQVGVSVNALKFPHQLTSVVIESGSASATLTYNPNTGRLSGTLMLPSGEQTITAKAFVDSQLVGTGSTTAVIEAYKSTAVSLRVYDITGGAPQPDAGPYITSLTAGSTYAVVAQPLNLQLNALDANGDALAYTWSSTCGGTFSAAAAQTAFSPDTVGKCTVTGTATSNGLSDSESFEFYVYPTQAQGLADVDLTFVPHPSVVAISIYSYYVPERYVNCHTSIDASNSMCPTAFPPSVTTFIGVGATQYDSSTTMSVVTDCGAAVQPDQNPGTYNFQPPPGLCTVTATIRNAEGVTSSLSASIYSK